MTERTDLALWKNEKGEFEGVIQGTNGEVPVELSGITKKWTFLEIPVPYKD